MHARDMLKVHPEVSEDPSEIFIRCIELCFDCVQTCTSCIDASTAEETVKDLKHSIRSCSDCADICLATGTSASRRTGSNAEVLRRLLDACVSACGACAAECEKHAHHHEHHRICGEVCRLCEAACSEAMQSLPRSDTYDQGL